jgi:hypothetical protein
MLQCCACQSSCYTWLPTPPPPRGSPCSTQSTKRQRHVQLHSCTCIHRSRAKTTSSSSTHHVQRHCCLHESCVACASLLQHSDIVHCVRARACACARMSVCDCGRFHHGMCRAHVVRCTLGHAMWKSLAGIVVVCAWCVACPSGWRTCPHALVLMRPYGWRACVHAAGAHASMRLARTCPCGWRACPHALALMRPCGWCLGVRRRELK